MESICFVSVRRAVQCTHETRPRLLACVSTLYIPKQCNARLHSAIANLVSIYSEFYVPSVYLHGVVSASSSRRHRRARRHGSSSRRRRQPSSGLLCCRLGIRCVGERARAAVQEPEGSDGGRLLLPGAARGQHHEPARFQHEAPRRKRDPGAQHARHLPRATRLRVARPQPAAHPPARHGGDARPPGLARRRLRVVQPGQQALHQEPPRRRCLRLPRRARPLPARRRERGIGDLRVQQPEPWAGRRGGLRVRRQAVNARRGAEQDVRGGQGHHRSAQGPVQLDLSTSMF